MRPPAVGQPPAALPQWGYSAPRGAVAAYEQRYQMSQQEMARRRALMEAGNMQAAQAALAAPLRAPPGNAVNAVAPAQKHKLYVKSKDGNCERAYDFFGRRYNKDSRTQAQGQPSDGYTKVTKRENLQRQIEVINVLRQPELRPAWLKGVPCLLKYNPADGSWKEHYGTQCIEEIHRIALVTPPDGNSADAVSGLGGSTAGYAINNTYEYADDPRYNGTGKVSGEETEYMKQLRDRQNHQYQSQQHGPVDFTIHEDDRGRVDYQQYAAQRGSVPQPSNRPLVRPEIMY
jgi:hypothetical protein